uniref:hypothetical protein n=1 Tax=Flavobacterium sp. TaxID=239 RepID=UPI00404924CA
MPKLLFKKIIDFYIRSSIHVAFAILSFAFASFQQLEIVPQINFGSFIFCSVIVGYNFLKYQYLITRNPHFLKEHRLLVLLTLLALILGIYFYFGFTRFEQFWIAVIAVFTLGYPFVRKWAFFKIFYVSLTVVLFTTVLPAMEFPDVHKHLIPLAFSLFFLISAWMIPFEIIDSQKDHLPHKTIPQLVGFPMAKIFGYLFLVAFTILHLFFFEIDSVKILMLVISVFAIYFATPNRSFYFSAFWVEAIPIVWFVLELM